MTPENFTGKLGYEWATAMPAEVDVQSEYYCQTRDIFQARLGKMIGYLLKNSGIKDDDVYILSAIAGEIGNNSFDHNLGSWPDIAGVFFAYEIVDGNIKIILADRGQGVLTTLKKVKPELKNDVEALRTAFTEKISGRAPENRGNGLKFVKENVKSKKIHLTFISGAGMVSLNEGMEVKETERGVKGCLAILTF